LSPAGRAAGIQDNRGQQPAAARGTFAAGRPGLFKTKILIKTEPFFYFQKNNKFRGRERSHNERKKLKGSLGRPAIRRPLKTRYTHSKILILNFMDFKGSGTVHLGRAVRGATERARALRQNGRQLAAAVSAMDGARR